MQQTEIFVILGHFFPFHPPTHTPPSEKQKNQNVEKLKIITGDTIILHMCTLNDNHMMYGS